jgi:DNA-binding transcriptional regulator YiaG
MIYFISESKASFLISGSQLRCARALLGLSAKELAELSGVGWATLQRFETQDGIPDSRSGTLDKVRAALEAQGIEFLGDPETSPGVRLRRKT